MWKAAVEQLEKIKDAMTWLFVIGFASALFGIWFCFGEGNFGSFKTPQLPVGVALCVIAIAVFALALGVLTRGHHPTEKTATAPTPPAIEIKYGELEFPLNQGEVQRNGMFIFDKPFVETPHVHIAEAGAGNWLLLKTDEIDARSFKWAARRAVNDVGHYNVRLQWVAIAGTTAPAAGKLQIERATYGRDGLNAVVTAILRRHVRNDALELDCTNDLFGDPHFGGGKTATVTFIHKGQRQTKTANEGQRLELP